jgi:uncharacterized phage protein gp47/JayE
MKIKTYNEILADILSKIATRTQITNFNVGSVARTMAEVFGGTVSELYDFLARALGQGFLATAEGYWLDLKAQEYGITRKQATHAYGNVILGRNQPKQFNISIPAGTIAATLKDQAGDEYRYITQQTIILPALHTEILVPVKAEHPGTGYNVGADAIKKLTVYVSGIDYVRNQSDWITSEGTDEETDDELRRRCFLAWEELAQGGTKAAYISWALSVNGVKNVYVNDNFPRGQGTVDIFILSTSGIPTPALIADAQLVIDANKPICSDSLVLAPVVRNVAMDVVITPRKYSDTSAIEGEIRNRMDAYFNPSGNPDYTWIEPLGIGRDVIFNQLVEVMMSVNGVYDVEFNTPADDINIAPDEFPVLSNFTINFDPEAEE